MNIVIERIMPCFAEPEKIRFIASIDEDISEFMPFLNRIIPGAIYNHKTKIPPKLQVGK